MLLHVRYDELALKGGRRGFYEGKLADNLASSLQISRTQVRRADGRIRVELPDADDPREPLDVLCRTFGVAYAGEVERLPREVDAAVEACVRLARGEIARGKRRFKVVTKRRDKHYPTTSTELSIQVGTQVHDALPELIVDVHEPEFKLTLEVEPHHFYVTTTGREGPRGLPVGTAGKALTLLSGGIDSPVAAWYAMKRGLHSDMLHFHAPPGTGPKAREKVVTLARLLSRWTPKVVRLYLVKTTEIQEAIMQGGPERLRVVLLRRSFLRIARHLVGWFKYKAVVGGEALGQVASQTPENLLAAQAAAPDVLYLRPLVGMDKIEIWRRAKAIGTYETSIAPHPDCCTLFAPRRPAVQSTIAECEAAEEGLGLPELELAAVESREKLAFRYGEAVEVRGR